MRTGKLKHICEAEWCPAWVKEVEVIGSFEAFRLRTTFLYNRPSFIAKLSVDKIFEVVNLASCDYVSLLEDASTLMSL